MEVTMYKMHAQTAQGTGQLVWKPKSMTVALRMKVQESEKMAMEAIMLPSIEECADCSSTWENHTLGGLVLLDLEGCAECSCFHEGTSWLPLCS